VNSYLCRLRHVPFWVRILMIRLIARYTRSVRIIVVASVAYAPTHGPKLTRFATMAVGDVKIYWIVLNNRALHVALLSFSNAGLKSGH
jgi:hypothetical protein